MAGKGQGSVGQPTEHLASWVDIKVDDDIVGYATTFSYQLNHAVVRKVNAGKKVTTPVAGQLAVALSLRGLVTTTKSVLTSDNVIESLRINNLEFKGCRLTAWNLTAQSGQIVLYSEAVFECEDVAINSRR
ncbi:MAG: hypothetical protein QXE80_03265 [Pyrobaculum sp.]